MRITASSVTLAATHVAERVTTRRESLQAWIGDEPGSAPAAGPGPRAARPAIAAPVAPAGRAAVEGAQAAAPAPGDEADAEGRTRGSARDELDLAILKRFFGLGRRLTRAAHDVRSAYAEGGRSAAAAASDLAAARQASGQGGQGGAPAREGWGLRYDATATTVAFEATSFSAAARVQTADGRTIDVAASLSMSRIEASTSEVHLRAGDAAVDPLVLDLAGGPATFGGPQAFDLNGDGKAEQVATLGPGAAYLALDRNGNGTIDSGKELFGPSTGSGFGELAALDQDGNGWVDEGDAAFAGLKLWSPSSGTLTGLEAAGVGALYTGAVATPFQVKGAGGATVAAAAETGLFLKEDGTAGALQHVDLMA